MTPIQALGLLLVGIAAAVYSGYAVITEHIEGFAIGQLIFMGCVVMLLIAPRDRA